MLHILWKDIFIHKAKEEATKFVYLKHICKMENPQPAPQRKRSECPLCLPALVITFRLDFLRFIETLKFVCELFSKFGKAEGKRRES